MVTVKPDSTGGSAPSSSTTDFLFSCHCQANVLRLSVPLLVETAAERDDGDTSSDGDKADTERVRPASNTRATKAQTEALAASGEYGGVLSCDCSICVKRLILWSIQPKERITILKGCERGKGTLKSYEFGDKVYDHCFCGTCGTHVFSSVNGMDDGLGLNLRAIREPIVNLYDLSPNQSKSYDKAPVYAEPELPKDVVSYLEGRKGKYDYPTVVHTASCHCQEVVFGVLAQELEKEDPFACLCSICTGNGNIWLRIGMHDLAFARPSTSPAVPYKPDHNLVTFYRFGAGKVNHVFCNKCGVQVYETIEGDGGEGFEGKKGEQADKMWVKVNVAAFKGVNGYLGDATGKGWGRVDVQSDMIDFGEPFVVRV